MLPSPRVSPVPSLARSSFLLRLRFTVSYPLRFTSFSSTLFTLILRFAFLHSKRLKCNNVTSAEVKGSSRKPEREEIGWISERCGTSERWAKREKESTLWCSIIVGSIRWIQNTESNVHKTKNYKRDAKLSGILSPIFILFRERGNNRYHAINTLACLGYLHDNCEER